MNLYFDIETMPAPGALDTIKRLKPWKGDARLKDPAKIE